MDDRWGEDGSIRGLQAVYGGCGKENSYSKGKGPQYTRVIPKFLQKYHQLPAIEAKFETLPKPADEEDVGLDEVQQAAIDKYIANNTKKSIGNVCDRIGDEQQEHYPKKKKNQQAVVRLGQNLACHGTKNKNKRKRIDTPCLSNSRLLSFSVDDE
ncbi:hypothetical protein CCR75_002677 [Bremia lactucae]|uniref:Uncharacterized protein n=1 Tax=Bremia lactucae TaxID=4779 RepID=A0A976NXK3_BRELC|nr:hypothetical protein CCR75_002677 [Bremia lactucae]